MTRTPMPSTAHRALVVERGWCHAERVAWTGGVLAEQMFDVR